MCFKISPKAEIDQILKVLNQDKFCVVVDEKNNCLGTITDGDIRRAIIKGLNLETKIDKIMYPDPLFAYKNTTKLKLIDLMKKNSIKHIPIVDDNKNVIGISSYSELIEIDEDKKGIKYKIRISEHVKNIIRNDSLNKKLALVVTSDITNAVNTELKNNDELEYIPISSVINPLGTILYGPNPEAINHDKRFRLELFYTEINN